MYSPVVRRSAFRVTAEDRTFSVCLRLLYRGDALGVVAPESASMLVSTAVTLDATSFGSTSSVSTGTRRRSVNQVPMGTPVKIPPAGRLSRLTTNEDRE